MTSKVSEDQTQQLLRTIEMFEAITNAQPDDYQSLEILKEAYNTLERKEDSLRISKRLASAYVSLGQISQAILEYEGIIQNHPDDSSAKAALSELEAKTSQLKTNYNSGASSLDKDSKPTPHAGATTGARPISYTGNSENALANVLIAEKLLTPQAARPLLERLQKDRPILIEKGQVASLTQLIVDEQIASLEDVLTIITDRSGLVYLPLSSYDIDRDIALLIPQKLCFNYCLVPFDIISRSILIACSNPFDTYAREQMQGMVDYNIFWYVSSPEEITKAIRKVHKLDSMVKV